MLKKLRYIEPRIDEIVRDQSDASIIRAGDFNQLPKDAVVEHTGLTQIVNQPARGMHVLDRMYESSPTYSVVGRVVQSIVRRELY